LTKAKLSYRESTHELVNEVYGIAYQISDDGIPILCVEDARRLSEKEAEALEAKQSSTKAS
jgi:uncharacterized protein YbaR (Trm112 family)